MLEGSVKHYFLKQTRKVYSFFVILFLIVGCSTKKDRFINRNFHAISTKYNVLFNGKEALRMGLVQLNENYEDNFWDRLPIEPLKVDKIAMPGMTSDQDSSPKEFEKAEEKAVKAVQKHSMVIVREERNKQIDDAYLLLGKARYYSKRFVPALEAFNFIINTYPDADLIEETKIWHAKTQIRLQNEGQAIENLKGLLQRESLDKVHIENANTALAMAYVQTDSIQQVIEHLTLAVEEGIDRDQTGRNYFILGQLYNELNKTQDANNAFNAILDLKKTTYKYKIQAHVALAKNAATNEEIELTRQNFKSLIKDTDNRSYLGVLYYQLGMLEIEQDQNLAKDLLEKSLRAKFNGKVQQELSFEALGNLFFDKADFLTAGAYYDSVITITESENTKRIRRIKRRRSNLDEVILYENISKVNDSILNLVAMNEVQRTAFFETYIEELKATDAVQNQEISTGSSFVSNNANKKNRGGSGKWYFYNLQAAGFGEQEFKRIWGNRPLENNWRLSDKTQLSFNNITEETVEQVENLDQTQKYDVTFYKNRIPDDLDEINNLKKERNDAYFKLGLIYKEQFKELSLAISKLEPLLSFDLNSSVVLPAKYHLFRIFEEQNNERASELRNDIITNDSNSKYAKIILNPNEYANENNENSPEKEYAMVFYEYKGDQFDQVIEKSSIAINKYEGLTIVAKFELLKAYAIGKKEGVEAFNDALQYVATNYSNTEEGKKATEVLNTLKSKIKSNQ